MSRRHRVRRIESFAGLLSLSLVLAMLGGCGGGGDLPSGGQEPGTFRIEGPRIYHDVQIATVPGRPGTSLMREWSFDGEDLILVAYDGPRAPSPNKAALRWRRVERGDK